MIYLASPYSHPDPSVRETRFKLTCAYAARLIQAGLQVFSPIAHTHPIEVYGYHDTSDLGFEYWKDFDLAMMESCSLLVVLRLDGWEESKGIKAEVAHAVEKSIPVLYAWMQEPPRRAK